MLSRGAWSSLIAMRWDFTILHLLRRQKSYTKKGKAAAKAALANGKIQNGKANGHITHDLNHNETDTKPSENKKENWAT